MKRRGQSRIIKDTILIVCGKTETEYNYFNEYKKHIKLSSGKVNIKILDKGSSPLEIVECAVSEKQSKEPNSPYKYIWAVFDKDEFNIEEAMKLANLNNILVAWSNEAFELWFIYHFEYFTSPLDRKYYKEKIEKLLNIKEYNKNDSSIFKRIFKYTNNAIENSKKSHQWHQINKNSCRDSCSCTTVYQLVEKLKDWE